MALEIFWASGSPFSWRVLLALELKRLPYTSRLLQMSAREHKTPEFLAMNPRGQVPVLRDAEVVVYESVAIMAYLDRKFPEPPLFGTSAAECGRIWQLVCETLTYLDALGDGFILPFYFNRADEEASAIRASIPRIQTELARYEALLADGAWLAGKAISAADLALFPIVKSLLRAVGKPAAEGFDHGLTPFAERYPALDGWRVRVEQLPGYDRTVPPHWR